MRKVAGVGINDSDDIVVKRVRIGDKVKTVWKCPFYAKWENMLCRCYNKKYQSRQSTYKDCSVCPEWLYFSNFKKWMEQQDWEGNQLDKDTRVLGNRIYSPDTCVFLPVEVHSFFHIASKRKGKYPFGVYKNGGGKYQNNSSHMSVTEYGGVFDTPEEAHQSWLKFKLDVLERDLLVNYKDPLIQEALVRAKCNIEHHLENNLELLKL